MLLLLLFCMFLCGLSLFCCVVLSVHSSFEERERERVREREREREREIELVA